MKIAYKIYFEIHVKSIFMWPHSVHFGRACYALFFVPSRTRPLGLDHPTQNKNIPFVEVIAHGPSL